jgi:hypothetical protein
MTKVDGTLFSFVIHKYVSAVPPSNYHIEMIQRAKVEIPNTPGTPCVAKHL